MARCVGVIPRDLITRGKLIALGRHTCQEWIGEFVILVGGGVVFAERRGMQQARLCSKQHAHPTPVSRYSMSTNARSASSSNAQASKVGLCVSSIESRGCHVQPLAVANERETNYGNTRRMLAQSQLVRFDARRKRLRLMHEWPRTGWRGCSG